MMNHTVLDMSLDGRWLLRHCPIGQGRPDAIAALNVYPYQVPGDVHTVFIEQGLIEEPLNDLNSLNCRWLEEEEFWCSRTFTLSRNDLRRRMQLVFGGLDCTADVWLNGVRLGRHSNAFVEAEFDVSGLLREGENELLVRIDQGLAEVADKPLRGMDSMWNNDQPYRAWMRKPQYVYGWDWTIWLPTCGIWKSVRLIGCDLARLTDVFAHTVTTELQENQPAEVQVEIAADCVAGNGYAARCQLTDADGTVIAEATVPCMDAASLTLSIPRARLWWPNGLGEAYLYDLTVTLLDAQGAMLHTCQQRIGLRTIELRQPLLESGESGFTFVINGVPVFSKGANVVPEDCLIGRVTDECTRDSVRLAREAHMNMLRVWGGGVYASEAFLHACDEAGIMVWHDFMFACGYHPDDDKDYMANIENEAVRALRRLRRHASLIGWSGNNEIQEMYTSQKQWKPDAVFYGRSIYEELLPRLVAAMHPGAIYRESSPLGVPEDPAGVTMGDQHKWDFTHRPNSPLYLDLWRFTDFRYKFLSEFGVIGAMPVESARQCISAPHLHPDGPVWLHHTNTSQEHGLLNIFVDKYFGGHDGLSLQQYTLRSQAIQAECTRHIYDECRARKFECSGLLFWTLGDSYGIHNWSLIDYYHRPRPVYHALRRAMAPVTAVIRGYRVQTNEGTANYRRYWAGSPDPLEIWGVNDTRTDRSMSLRWRVMTLDGCVLRSETLPCRLPANAAGCLAKADVAGLGLIPEETILVAELTDETGLVSENRYFFAPIGEMAGRSGVPACTAEAAGPGLYRLRLKSDRFVWMLHIETPDGVTVPDNDFDLLPGEERSVLVHTVDPAYQPRLHWIGEAED